MVSGERLRNLNAGGRDRGSRLEKRCKAELLFPGDSSVPVESEGCAGHFLFDTWRWHEMHLIFPRGPCRVGRPRCRTSCTAPFGKSETALCLRDFLFNEYRSIHNERLSYWLQSRAIFPDTRWDLPLSRRSSQDDSEMLVGFRYSEHAPTGSIEASSTVGTNLTTPRRSTLLAVNYPQRPCRVHRPNGACGERETGRERHWRWFITSS